MADSIQNHTGSGTSSPTTRHRPLGVTFLALLFGAFALLDTAMLVLLPIVSSDRTSTYELIRNNPANTLLTAVSFAVAVGLWRRQSWSRWLAVATLAVIAVLRFPIGVIPALPLVIYLCQSRLTPAFQRVPNL